MIRNVVRVVKLLGLCVMANAAVAANISSIYSTGVDASGKVLPDMTIDDPHYDLVGPSGDLETRIYSTEGHPGSAWVADDLFSRWIGPNPNFEGPKGLYRYRTSFDLTGLNSNTAQISGRWSSDNQAIDIVINGISLNGSPFSNESVFPNNYGGFATFSIGHFFIDGINTLDFIVNEAEGQTATGLRVEILSATADIAPIPEPETYAMMLAGLGLLGLSVRGRKHKATWWTSDATQESENMK
jgi:hypothetical protein